MGGAGVYLCRDCADELMKNDFKMKKRSEKLRFFAVYLRFIRAASGGIIRRQKRYPLLKFGILYQRMLGADDGVAIGAKFVNFCGDGAFRVRKHPLAFNRHR